MRWGSKVKPTRYATLPDMNCATEKGRGTTGRGRADGPNRSNHLGRPGCVHGPSHPDAKCVSLPAIRTLYMAETGDFSLSPLTVGGFSDWRVGRPPYRGDFFRFSNPVFFLDSLRSQSQQYLPLTLDVDAPICSRELLQESCVRRGGWTNVKISPVGELPGGRASGEQREPVCPRSVGPDRGAPDRTREDRPGRPTSCAVRTHRPAGCLVARPTPLTGTCILRRIPGSTRSKLRGRGRETCKPGVSR